MRFGVITHAGHKVKNDQIYAYEPYVREMNLWLEYPEDVIILAPRQHGDILPIEAPYLRKNIQLKPVWGFNLKSFKGIVRSLLAIPMALIAMFRLFSRADHVHVRCPGNMGLLACLVQVFFPRTHKTVKYAGNWDPNSKQPWSYRLQKKILSNTFLTRNCKVLVYGEWENQSKNIVPFFTASYTDVEAAEVYDKKWDSPFHVVFVGTLTENKRPFLVVEAIHELIKKGYNVVLNVYGDGPERTRISAYIDEHKLEKVITLHGNQPKNSIKDAFKRSHFLIFISRSEGWPKVVAEAMFWGCVPIVSSVSCVPYMIGENERGSLVRNRVEDIVQAFEDYAKDLTHLKDTAAKAQDWSRQFTLDSFKLEISKLLHF